MVDTRRNFIKKTLASGSYLIAAASGLLLPLRSLAEWPAARFSNLKVDETLRQIMGEDKALESDEIAFKLPRIAENGAVVPITVTCNLENVESISILVEKNPVPLIASFTLSSEANAFVSARMKMAETSEVIALVKADGKYYTARQTVKVTIGGCGG
ncbi:MAG: thiosulfate oxidation carrier protein SoxY [Gammaproteobacteria bacterium]